MEVAGKSTESRTKGVIFCKGRREREVGSECIEQSWLSVVVVVLCSKWSGEDSR